MTKHTFPVNSGAVPKIQHSAVMTLAWANFRRNYCYPKLKFSSICRHCFQGCLRQAWADAKLTACSSSIRVGARAERVADPEAAIAIEFRGDYWPSARASIANMRADISHLPL